MDTPSAPSMSAPLGAPPAFAGARPQDSPREVMAACAAPGMSPLLPASIILCQSSPKLGPAMARAQIEASSDPRAAALAALRALAMNQDGRSEAERARSARALAPTWDEMVEPEERAIAALAALTLGRRSARAGSKGSAGAWGEAIGALWPRGMAAPIDRWQEIARHPSDALWRAALDKRMVQPDLAMALSWREVGSKLPGSARAAMIATERASKLAIALGGLEPGREPARDPLEEVDLTCCLARLGGGKASMELGLARCPQDDLPSMLPGLAAAAARGLLDAAEQGWGSESCRGWGTLLRHPAWRGADQAEALDTLAQAALRANEAAAYMLVRPMGPKDAPEEALAHEKLGAAAMARLGLGWLARSHPKPAPSASPNRLRI